MTRKKKAAGAAISARRSAKREHRKQEKRKIASEMWAAPAPPGLVAKLDAPKIKSKYHSYFEFAENTEKKKKLEYQVTDKAIPPPGFEFVPIGNPELTNACKELSREQDAMIFIVSGSKETNLRISDHVFRKGFHFRSTIVEEARSILGEQIYAENGKSWQHIEPIPESQEEINKQADAAIRDLFPRIPNTDRQLIIQHAFQKGVLFHGEATVGLQPDIPLWRRVQLAVVAHIRHNHTRYDKLLRETSWMNARKAVEPVCLDVLVKWRGDEETGRDQLDEILREVVVITDSEDEDASSSEDTSEEDDDNLPREMQIREQSKSAPERQLQPTPSDLARSLQHIHPSGDNLAAESVVQIPRVSPRIQSKMRPAQTRKDKRAQRGFKRYQAAWEQAVNRQREEPALSPPRPSTTSKDPVIMPVHRPIGAPSTQEAVRQTPDSMNVRSLRPAYYDQNDRHIFNSNPTSSRLESYYPERRPTEVAMIQRNEVNVHPLTNHRTQHPAETTYVDATPYIPREQERLSAFRRSPPRHRLQDMLVPSIESPSVSSATVLQSRRANSPQGSYVSYDRHPMPNRRQVVQARRESPPPQVIIISDDSPKVKRPRLLYEDENSHFRSAQPANGGSSFIGIRNEASPRFSTTLIEPQAQRQNFPPSNQGLSHGSQTSMSSSFVPMQDSRYHYSGNGVMPRHSDQVHGAEHNSNFNPRGEAPRQDQSYQRVISNDREYLYSRPPDHNVRVIERGQMAGREQFDLSPREHATRPISPAFPVPSRISRSHEMRTGPAVADQTFIHRFSQSRLESAAPEPREDGFVVLPPQRPHRSFVAQHVDPRPYPEQTHRYLPIPSHHQSSDRDRDTAQHSSGLSQTVYPGRLHVEDPQSVSRDQELYAPRGGPVYVRPTPRQQVIVLD